MYDYGFDRVERKQDEKEVKKGFRKERRHLAKNIFKQLNAWRPKDEDFDSIYSDAKMAGDGYEIEEFSKKKGLNHNKKIRLRDGLELEGVFCRVDEIELFEETSDDARYDYLFTEDEDFALQAFPAHKYDDIFNNTDIYCTLCNTDTDHVPLVFSVDCTTNDAKVGEKMGYQRSKLEISGATAAEYFKDMQQSDPEKQNFPLGKIEVMPHFVVGCDAETSDELAKFLYGFNDPRDLGKYDKTQNPIDYKNALDHVRTCVIAELREQAEANLAMLRQKSTESPSPELDKLISDYERLARYFSNTFEFLEQQREVYQPYKFDPVYARIHGVINA